jgi:phosphoglycerate kinase
MGLDIGPKTIENYKADHRQGQDHHLERADGRVRKATLRRRHGGALAKAVAESGAVFVVGGGDSEKAVKAAGVADKITHISTGGGASLEFLSGIELPGVAALTDKA